MYSSTYCTPVHHLSVCARNQNIVASTSQSIHMLVHECVKRVHMAARDCIAVHGVMAALAATGDRD